MEYVVYIAIWILCGVHAAGESVAYFKNAGIPPKRLKVHAWTDVAFGPIAMALNIYYGLSGHGWRAWWKD